MAQSVDNATGNTVDTTLSTLRNRMETAQRLCSLLAQNASIVHNVAHSKPTADGAKPVHPQPHPLKPLPSPGTNGNTPPQTSGIQRAVLTPVPLNLSMGPGGDKIEQSPIQRLVTVNSMGGNVDAAVTMTAVVDDASMVSGEQGRLLDGEGVRDGRRLLGEVERLNKVIEEVTRVNEDLQESTQQLMQAKGEVEEELGITRQALAEANAKLQAKDAMDDKKVEGLQLQVVEGNAAQRQLRAELERTQHQLKKLHAFVQDERALNSDLSRSATKIAIRNEELEGLVDHLEGQLRMGEPQLLANTPARYVEQSVMEEEEKIRERSEDDRVVASKRQSSTAHTKDSRDNMYQQLGTTDHGVKEERRREVTMDELGTPGPLAYSSPVVTPIAQSRSASTQANVAEESRNLFHNPQGLGEKPLTPSNQNDTRMGRSIDTSIERTLNDSALSLSPSSAMQRTRLRVDGKTGVIDIDMSPQKETRNVDGMKLPSARLLRITASLDSEFKDAEDLTNRLSDELHTPS